MGKFLKICSIVFWFFAAVGCKETKDGGWDSFQWQVESVSNPDHTDIDIDKQGNVRINVNSNKEKIILVVSNYTPWGIMLIEEDGQYERGYRITRDWGTVTMEKQVLAIDINNLTEEFADNPIRMEFQEGDAFSHLEIYRR